MIPRSGHLYGYSFPTPPVSYSTTFSGGNENPISEGGVWIRGKTDRTDWQDPKISSGIACASTVNADYDDNVAHLDPNKFAIPADQEVIFTIYLAGGYSPSDSHECSGYLRASSQSGSPNLWKGYEILVPLGGGGGEIVRWNGALGDFTSLSVTGTGFGTIAIGDAIHAKIVGSTITVYQNGSQVLTTTDSTYSTGMPGIGFFMRSGGTLTSYGMTDYLAQAAT